MISQFVESGLIPDIGLRAGIRHFLKKRIKDDIDLDIDSRNKKFQSILKTIKTSPIAVQTQDANDQHYELPPEFFELCLGKKLKYSCGLWNQASSLDEAEEEMLQETVTNAQLYDGAKILELGCGWGSLTLYMAQKYPNSDITAVSNSADQRKHIENRLKKLNLTNVKIITKDMNDFVIDEKFDRVVSVEMFEHMRNYSLLLKRISTFLNDEGKLFVHIFVHRDTPYFFEVKDDSDWMSKYFFSGGIMPSDHLLYYFNDHLKIVDHKNYSGVHYSKTAEEWLANMDKNKDAILKIFKKHYKHEAKTWWNYWRVFFMSCSELWKYREGKEWFVSHYLFEKSQRSEQ